MNIKPFKDTSIGDVHEEGGGGGGGGVEEKSHSVTSLWGNSRVTLRLRC